MNRATEQDLIRLLHGELPDETARELRARLDREPELARAWARLERTWTGLEMPPPSPTPPGFAQRVLARARREGGNGGAWNSAPRWVRAAAAVALAAGVALGAGAGSWASGRASAGEELPSLGMGGVETAEISSPSLAETYWDSLEEMDSTPGPEPADGESL